MYPGGTTAWLLAATLLASGCKTRPLTARTHEPAGPCAVRNGAEITCAGSSFARVMCDPAYNGCMKLVLAYADGDVALLYKSSADPKLYRATQVAIAADGSRIWFLEMEGLFSSKLTWHVFDVRSGVLKDVEPSGAGRVPADLEGARTVPLHRESTRQPQRTP